jgi:hypothetical protein
MADWLVGADIGKRSDNTALCIVQRQSAMRGPGDPKRSTSGRVPGPETVFVVREIGRLPLGTRHTVGAYKIASALHDLRVADPTGEIRFLLDVTGVGESIADLIEGYIPNTVKMTRSWFTGAERLDKRGREWHVGKPWLVSRLTSLLETGRVKLPDTPQSQALVEELRDFEYRVTPSANLVAEARVGLWSTTSSPPSGSPRSSTTARARSTPRRLRAFVPRISPWARGTCGLRSGSTSRCRDRPFLRPRS